MEWEMEEVWRGGEEQPEEEWDEDWELFPEGADRTPALIPEYVAQ